MVNYGKDPATGIRSIRFGAGKKTMVILPGLTLGYVTDNAAAIEEGFSAFAADYTVWLFDVREQVPSGYTLRGMCDDLVTAITNLGLSELYLYGCSMGGMLAQYLAGSHPELVRGVVAASSACRANETSEKVIGNWIRLAREGKCRMLTADMGQMICSAAVYEQSRDAFASMADSQTSESLTRFINSAGAAIGYDIRTETSAIQCPVLVLGSRGDRVLTPEGSEQIAELTGGELFLYGEEYPHDVYDEAPDFRERVKAFFDRVNTDL